MAVAAARKAAVVTIVPPGSTWARGTRTTGGADHRHNPAVTVAATL
jgi:hypothetical protein